MHQKLSEQQKNQIINDFKNTKPTSADVKEYIATNQLDISYKTIQNLLGKFYDKNYRL